MIDYPSLRCADALCRPCDCDVLYARRAELEASLAELDEQLVAMLEARVRMNATLPALP